MIKTVQQCSFRFPLWQGFPKAINAWIQLTSDHASRNSISVPRFPPLLPQKPAPSSALCMLCSYVRPCSLSFLPFPSLQTRLAGGERTSRHPLQLTGPSQHGEADGRLRSSTRAGKLRFPDPLRCSWPATCLFSPWDDQTDCVSRSSRLKSMENVTLLLLRPRQCPVGSAEQRM